MNLIGFLRILWISLVSSREAKLPTLPLTNASTEAAANADVDMMTIKHRSPGGGVRTYCSRQQLELNLTGHSIRFTGK